MSYLGLKCLAVFLMLLDHIGVLTGNLFLRAVGRICFPIFAFLISNGLKYTHNKIKYTAKIFAFACISEIPFDLVFEEKINFFSFDNIFFTLFLGMIFLISFDFLKEKFKASKITAVILSLPMLCLVVFIPTIISCDYGVFGVLTVIAFGVLDVHDNYQRIILIFALSIFSCINLYRFILYNIFCEFGIKTTSSFLLTKITTEKFPVKWQLLQLLRLLAIIPISLYNGKSGQPKNKTVKKIVSYSFYCFYPVHLLVMYFVSSAFS